MTYTETKEEIKQIKQYQLNYIVDCKKADDKTLIYPYKLIEKASPEYKMSSLVNPFIIVKRGMVYKD